MQMLRYLSEDHGLSELQRTVR